MKVELLKALRSRFKITIGYDRDDFMYDRYTVQFTEKVPEFGGDPNRNKVVVRMNAYQVKISRSNIPMIWYHPISLFIVGIAPIEVRHILANQMEKRRLKLLDKWHKSQEMGNYNIKRNGSE